MSVEPAYQGLEASGVALAGEPNVPPGSTSSAQHRRNQSLPMLTIDTARAQGGDRSQGVAPPPRVRGKSVSTSNAALPPPPPPPPPPPSRTRSSDLPLRQTRHEYNPSTTSQTSVQNPTLLPQYRPSEAAAPSTVAPRPSPGSPPVHDMEDTNRYAASLYTASRALHAHNNSLSHAFAMSNDPANAPLPSYRESMMDIPAVIQSSPSDILDLWLLASGQETTDVAICYNLGVECVDLTNNAELICLTSTGGTLYTLAATSDDLNVIRTHPFNASNTVSIATPRLYTPGRGQSPELVTYIFPVLSKIRAIDEAASVTLTKGLSRMDGSALERQFIKEAHLATAAPLMVNLQTGQYCLSLPVASESSGTKPSRCVLPFEVNPDVSIRILEPYVSGSGVQGPILTFSIPNKTLIVHVQALLELPSPYSVDILLSSMLALILHLHRQNKVLITGSNAVAPDPVQARTVPIPVPTFAPPPLVAVDARGRSRSTGRPANARRGQSSSHSRGPSRLGALLHPARAHSALSSHPVQPEAQNRSASRLSTYSMQSMAPTLSASPPLPSSNTDVIRPSCSTGGDTRTGLTPSPHAYDLEKGFSRTAVEEVDAARNKELTPQGFKRTIWRIRAWAQRHV